eukprot:scaffold54418_cov31-Tisochrysis_lutea.AAC.2
MGGGLPPCPSLCITCRRSIAFVADSRPHKLDSLLTCVANAVLAGASCVAAFGLGVDADAVGLPPTSIVRETWRGATNPSKRCGGGGSGMTVSLSSVAPEIDEDACQLNPMPPLNGGDSLRGNVLESTKKADIVHAAIPGCYAALALTVLIVRHAFIACSRCWPMDFRSTLMGHPTARFDHVQHNGSRSSHAELRWVRLGARPATLGAAGWPHHEHSWAGDEDSVVQAALAPLCCVRPNAVTHRTAAH